MVCLCYCSFIPRSKIMSCKNDQSGTLFLWGKGRGNFIELNSKFAKLKLVIDFIERWAVYWTLTLVLLKEMIEWNVWHFMSQFYIEYMKELYLFSFNIHSTSIKCLQVLQCRLQRVLSSVGETHKPTKRCYGSW